ncbi:MAG TPA: hypothetical protein VIX86_10580 [Streptosporangiaceae bacterium]
MCQWVSTSPGATIIPAAPSSAVPGGTASPSPTAMILSPAMCTSPRASSPIAGSMLSR